ncbi:hypothetical protein AGOR_G00037700 [Albula goreensis]|uniref:Uncharacterized protein n=1 Tax=Albula goreensis TaxID=1534307 RepID=A0A8T3E4D8_9TELE|nr:hypothetical protein AGOR_G00037700 [Albula goreensis]
MADDMDYLESIRFLFDEEDTTAEQDTVTDEAVEANMEDYLEDIRFLFDAEDTTAEQNTMTGEAGEADMEDYLEDIRFLFDGEGVKKVKNFREKVKKMKEGVRRFFSCLWKDARRSFSCCVSVEME